MSTLKQLKRHPVPRLIVLLIAVGGILYMFGTTTDINIEQDTLVRLLTGIGSFAPFAYFFFGDRVKQWLSSIFYLIKPAQVAEIELRGPIKEDVEQGPFGGADAIPSKQVVKRIKKAADKHYDAIVINIDSPGGQPVPSDDIRRALEAVDVPTYTYINTLCASGGYLIACGTDYIHARRDSLVGSIGVIANMHKAAGLADKLGVEYERFVGGEHKDTHRPLKELDEEERDYWQGVIDDSYDRFVGIVANSRGLSPDAVRATKAEILHGSTALEDGLVDDIGSRQDFLQTLQYELDIANLKIRTFDGNKKVWGNVENLFSGMAYAFGRGLGTAFTNRSEQNRLEYRL